MAITIQQTPENYSPAYNPIWWVVSSTNTAQANFQYICDVYITGVTFAGGATYLRLKCPADPTYGRGVFNVSPILQRQLTSDIQDVVYGFQQAPNSIIEYDVKFGELYGASSGVIAYPSLTNSTGRTAFNGSLNTIEFKDYDSDDYVANTFSTQINFLTNMPSSGTIRTDENAWIYAMSQTSGAIKFAHVVTYDSTNTLIYSYYVINHQYFNTATIANRMLRFTSGYNMDDIVAGNITNQSGTALPILSRPESPPVARYEIYFTDSSHNRITESYYFKIDNPCTNHTVYRLHFKNKFGAFDSFSFIRASQISSDIKRDKYEKVLGEFKSGSSYTYNIKDRFETSFHSTYKHTIKLNSDWINENQSVWLEELMTSPEIYLEEESDCVPVNIIETKYTQRQHKTDKIFNLEVNIERTFNNIRQGA